MKSPKNSIEDKIGGMDAINALIIERSRLARRTRRIVRKTLRRRRVRKTLMPAEPVYVKYLYYILYIVYYVLYCIFVYSIYDIECAGRSCPLSLHSSMCFGVVLSHVHAALAYGNPPIYAYMLRVIYCI